MKRKCPYCGRRISYVSAFSSRRKAEFVCGRCGKESRIRIKKRVIPIFIAFAAVSIAIMILWITNDLSYNPLGILLVAIPLIIFTFVSPCFVRFEPLKKYKKSMEAKKAGKEFSDSLTSTAEESDLMSGSTDNKFKINSDVFNKIKAERTAAREKNNGENSFSDSNEINTQSADDNEKRYAHVIEDVSENRATTDAPLKKIHSDSNKNVRRHYIPQVDDDSDDDDVKEYVKGEKKDGNKYSANRRF